MEAGIFTSEQYKAAIQHYTAVAAMLEKLAKYQRYPNEQNTLTEAA